MGPISNALTMGQLEVVVAKKQLDAIEQQGENALVLIEAAAPVEGAQSSTPANVSAGVGGRLNITG